MKKTPFIFIIIFAIMITSCGDAAKNKLNIIEGSISLTVKCTEDVKKLPATINVIVKSNLNFDKDNAIGAQQNVKLTKKGFNYTGKYKLSAGNVGKKKPKFWDPPFINKNVCTKLKIKCDNKNKSCKIKDKTRPKKVPYKNPNKFDISESCNCL